MSPSLIASAAEALHRAAPPRSRVILFGSHARGQARADSDLDFCVIEPEVADRRKEMSRLRMSMRPLPIFADVMVASEAEFSQFSVVPGTIYHEIAREGREI